MHRFSFDGRYLYGSPTFEGFVGNVMGIFDLKNPAKPELVGRWHMPGQWTAGGETPTWQGDAPPLPSSAAHGQPALHQLLAGRLRHSRHLRHVEAEIRVRARLVAALSVPDPLGDAGAVRDRGPKNPAGRGRGRDAPVRGAAGVPLGGRHHAGGQAGAVRLVPGGRSSTARRRRSTSAATSRSRRSPARRFPPPGS